MSLETFGSKFYSANVESLDKFILWLSAELEKDPESWHAVGESCLNAFVLNNFVGPPKSATLLPEFFDSVTDDVRKVLCSANPTSLVPYRQLEMLLVASKILLANPETLTDLFWSLRCLCVWQRILPEPDSSLQKQCAEIIAKIENLPSDFGQMSKEWQTEFHLLCVGVWLSYFEHSLAEQHLQKALDLCQLSVHLTGALGKRTRFQEQQVAQLRLEISGGTGESDDSSKDLPVNCKLNDDTLLEKVQFTEDLPQNSLSALEQAVLLAAYSVLLKTQHLDELLTEKLLTYLEKIVEHCQCWSIQTTALYNRCRLERFKRRKVERSLAQSEELANRFAADAESVDRMRLFYAIDAPSIIHIQKLQADILVTLGCTSEALAIFERLQSWDEVVGCYRSLNKLEHAEHLVRKMLETKEEPVYYCLLGDITINPEYYHKAWEVSDGHCARAQDSLGLHLMRGKHYDEAMKAFELALKIQPLKLGSWYNFGYCAMQLKRYNEAARAYHRCSCIEPDNFEVWNNLSASYVYLNQKEKAFRIIQEALKHNFDNWKVWENYLFISADTGHIWEAIIAFNRLRDLDDKYMDLEVLRLITSRVVEQQTTDGADRLTPEFRKLLGRITAKTTSEAWVWRCYADVCTPSDTENTFESWDKYVRLLQKAHQNASMKQDWEKDLEECGALLKYALNLSRAQLKRASLGSDENQEKSSIRLTLKSLLARVKKQHATETDELPDKLQATVVELEEILKSIT